MVRERARLQVNISIDNFDLAKIRVPAYFVGLVAEFKLNTVEAIKLLPLIGITHPILPGPVEILNILNFISNLSQNNIIGRCHFLAKRCGLFAVWSRLVELILQLFRIVCGQ